LLPWSPLRGEPFRETLRNRKKREEIAKIQECSREFARGRFRREATNPGKSQNRRKLAKGGGPLRAPAPYCGDRGSAGRDGQATDGPVEPKCFLGAPFRAFFREQVVPQVVLKYRERHETIFS